MTNDTFSRTCQKRTVKSEFRLSRVSPLAEDVPRRMRWSERIGPDTPTLAGKPEWWPPGEPRRKRLRRGRLAAGPRKGPFATAALESLLADHGPPLVFNSGIHTAGWRGRHGRQLSVWRVSTVCGVRGSPARVRSQQGAHWRRLSDQNGGHSVPRTTACLSNRGKGLEFEIPAVKARTWYSHTRGHAVAPQGAASTA